MCGIAGYLLKSETPEASVVHAMCTAMRHRGPDDEGIHTERHCGIGMRRLSIIDLATGHQPISNEDQSIWVVFNGEVYNYQALREQLISQGHRFQTNSDTETLVHLYEQEGLDGISKLRGMFAYAIWDRRADKLTLVRDRFGKKPLYYLQRGDAFYFASELKCLAAVAGPFEMDDVAIRAYLQLGYIPDPLTCYRGVKKLPAGFWMEVTPDGSMKQGRYWRLPEPIEEESGLSREEALEQLRSVFDESVRMRMIADVPLGAFLSGGLDSSLVVASMALQSSAPIRTFSIGWEEKTHNELHYARMVAKSYSTDHEELIVRPDVMELVPRLVAHLDEPFSDASMIPTYLVSELAARHVKVALSGDGGDELFGGYPSFQWAANFQKADRIPQAVRQVLGTAAKLLPESAYGKNYLHTLSRPTSFERFAEFGMTGAFFRSEQALNPEWRYSHLSWENLFGDALLPEGRDPVSQAMHYEATAKLTGQILTKVDRMSMAASLEVRTPLLDHKIGELAGRIPNRWKMGQGKGKLILLESMANRLPPALLDRPKMGFGVPLEAWFRGPLRDLLRDHLFSASFLSRGITQRKGLEALVDEHDRGRRNNAEFLWVLLVLELWFRNAALTDASGGGSESGSITRPVVHVRV